MMNESSGTGNKLMGVALLILSALIVIVLSGCFLYGLIND